MIIANTAIRMDSGSQLLALCMKDHGKELSPECIKALEDAGEVTPEEKSELKKIGE